MHEMVIYGVSFDLVGKQPIVLLKTADGNKFLPIWIGHPEAAAILMKLQGASTPRPMTHDLVTEMLSQLDAQVVRITVTELKENTFYASITVQQNGSEIEIEREDVTQQEIVNEVKQFLETVTPDEFAEAEGLEED
jgi:bifunctional DNase/RNase